MSIKSVLGVAVILGLTCAQVQAGPKRYPWGDRNSGRDLDAFRYDIHEAEQLREIEADGASPNLRAAAKADPPTSARANGWTFDLITIWYAPTHSTIRREPYGVFASKDECAKARANKIVQLDEGGYRQPHLLPNQPVITTSIAVANATTTTTTTSQRPGGPTETMNVLSCRAGVFTIEGQTVAQKN